MPVLVGFRAFHPTSRFLWWDTDASPQSGTFHTRDHRRQTLQINLDLIIFGCYKGLMHSHLVFFNKFSNFVEQYFLIIQNNFRNCIMFIH